MSDAEAPAFDPAFAESMLDAAKGFALQLVDLLARERDALASRDLGKLQEVVVNKDRVLEALAQLERSAALRVSDTDLAQLESPERERLQRLRDDVRALLARCRDANTVNSRLVQRARHAVDEVLATLTGIHRQGTYTPTGGNAGASGSRTIGKA